jgi:protocatechuate 3,4-dioxygenase beta subunit
VSPLVLLLALLLPVQTEKCTVSGAVTDSVTSEPLTKVELRLEPLDRKANHVAVTRSDAKGAFSLIDLEPGAYRLWATRSGYFESSYGARRADADGSILRLEPGQSLAALTVKLTPASVISGTVRDSDGEPIEDAHVVLARLHSEHGRQRIRADDSTNTDDRGQYRFRGLAGGTYFIGVEPQSAGWDRVDHSATGAAETSVPTLYPGVTDVLAAAPIALAAGKRMEGMDVTLVRSRVFTVRGRVLNAPGAARTTVTLSDSRNAAMRDHGLRSTTRDAAGNFEFRNVPPGAYRLTASQDALRGDVSIVVAASDLDGLRVPLTPGADVKLHVSAPEEVQPKVIALQFLLTTDGRSGFGPFPVGPDPTTAHNVPPDHYEVQLDRIPPGLYLKSATAGQTDVLADGLTIGGPGLVTIDATLANDGATLNGSVPPAATVLLVPARRSRSDLYRTASADQNGHYEFNAVAPGDYKIYAYLDAEPDLDNDKLGEKLTLDPKSKTKHDLTLP